MTTAFAPHTAAAAFVAARRAARFLPGYPGPAPIDLAQGYAAQEVAIGLWPDRIAGWKIGRIPLDWEETLGQPRLAGPIFARNVWQAGDADVTPFPVFVGGFAAVEAEYVFRLGADAPSGKTTWTEDEAAELVATLHIGIEPAGSPLATINDLGPPVVVSDFGNNAGLILGPEISNWRARGWDSMRCETVIDGVRVGTGGASSIPGGPLSALRFLASHLAGRGRPLKAGDLISTGASTGIHDIVAGQAATVDFGRDGVLRCRAVAATPLPDGPP
ncbi:2-keto-4-pentenoate hydratase [Nitrospirillum pindoramense]|uniref:2-keto-4-pentenoate hydratase n=1 Tax=Nitrospirillum amazonense TaxID=28077 RepID=A0A560HDC9_9PROT|nr:2-keto-4-pentenoate hydratase [Nitrospirillum amazonense]TWB44396.1 2-keto-4-pentenoate hydratase [Nitrospirillum amazonense]